jgi:CHAD domain-containing protein
MDLVSAFAAIANACVKQYRLNEAILLERHVPEAVHQARIGLRRLRSAMTLFKALLAGSDCDRLNARLRDLAQCLGEARDLDVLFAQAGPGPIRERLGHAREAAHSAMQRRLKGKTTRLLLLDLSEWIADGRWRSDPATRELRETPLPQFAAAALDRLRRKLAKDGRHLAALDIEARHRVRKDAKKLRYAVEFLAPLFDAKARRKRFSKALEALQDDLGALNDRATAEERLASLGLVGTPEVAQYLSHWQTGNLIEDAARARHALLEVKPFWR